LNIGLREKKGGEAEKNPNIAIVLVVAGEASPLKCNLPRCGQLVIAKGKKNDRVC